MATSLASQRLIKLNAHDGVSVCPKGEAIVLSLSRPELLVVVTVPLEVLEWFVEASDPTNGSRVQDWCDYEGYDSTATEQLDRDMADDVEHFVDRLLRRELRLGKRGGDRISLEWKVGEAWRQAIPFTGDDV
jgi:hypothetical protein